MLLAARMTAYDKCVEGGVGVTRDVANSLQITNDSAVILTAIQGKGA
jgi:uncharacterized UPF0146 family protein